MYTLKKPRILVVMLVLVMVSATGIARPPLAAAQGAGTDRDISLELIGQVAAPIPSRTLAYGYLSYVKGVAPDALAAGGDLSEGTARFIFYVDTINTRVINNGPLRVIDRAGTLGLYLDNAPNGNWSRPETFHDGEQILGAELRYQVVINTSTGAFSAHWDLPISWSRPFAVGGSTYRLGNGGEHFEITMSGQLNAQAPPVAHIAGVARGLQVRR